MFLEELPYMWYDSYVETTARPTNVVRFPYNEFEYIFDYYTDLEIKGTVAVSDTIEDRVIGVI